ncbi:MAG: Rrf2 family transcriptional regulator [Firmicutes bacterium]|nr:Rrf2 family transcriptional regulator [Bacillota bacterium]
MRFSTRGEYGLRAMLVLADNYQQEPKPLREIAQAEAISEQYLEQLFRELKRAGLVDSRRGARGGYVLSAPPEQISMDRVIQALEGPIGPMECVTEAGEDLCAREHCATRILWQKLKSAMEAVLSGTTLADLLGEAKRSEP